MTLDISLISPGSDEAAPLLAGSQAAMEAVFDPEDLFTLDAEALIAARASFFVARLAGRAVGCVAAVPHGGYIEVKRLFVEKEARGHGTARALMGALEEHARAAPVPVVRLETGAALIAAVALYRALGYEECGAFGDYACAPSSLFMEKRLTTQATDTQ